MSLNLEHQPTLNIKVTLANIYIYMQDLGIDVCLHRNLCLFDLARVGSLINVIPRVRIVTPSVLRLITGRSIAGQPSD